VPRLKRSERLITSSTARARNQSSPRRRSVSHRSGIGGRWRSRQRPPQIGDRNHEVDRFSGAGDKTIWPRRSIVTTLPRKSGDGPKSLSAHALRGPRTQVAQCLDRTVIEALWDPTRIIEGLRHLVDNLLALVRERSLQASMMASTLSAGRPTSLPRRSCALDGKAECHLLLMMQTAISPPRSVGESLPGWRWAPSGPAAFASLGLCTQILVGPRSLPRVLSESGRPPAAPVSSAHKGSQSNDQRLAYRAF